MKLKHKFLEQIRKSPELASKFSEEKGQGGKTMVRVWDRSISHFHQEGEEEAFRYLLNGLLEFRDTKEHRQRKELYYNKLKNYIKEYNSYGFKSLKIMSHLKIDIQHNNFITGEVFRIDKTPENGYAITLLNRTDEVWAHQLRFRLLQIHYSNLYKCPHDLIKVGIYNFEKEKHEYFSFDDEELREAWAEISGISSKINQFKL